MKRFFSFYLALIWCPILFAQTPDISCPPSITVNVDPGCSAATVMSDLSASSTDHFARLRQTAGPQPAQSLWAWGYDNKGQLGIGMPSPQQESPVKVGLDSNWVSISAGEEHSLGIRSDSTLWAWGSDQYGQLGDGGSSMDQTAPVQVGAFTDWIAVSAGKLHSLGIRADSSLWAWGSDAQGRLGNGSTTGNQYSPVKIGSATDWIAISAGGGASYGIRADGSLWAWGNNGAGQLGIGAGPDLASPVQVGSDLNWVAVAGGVFHCLALKANGTLWAWGEDFFSDGYLGLGTTTSAPMPQQVGTGTQWIGIAAGPSHSLGLQADGSLWAWGSNRDGRLGLGSSISNANMPTQVGSDTDWAAIAAGGFHSLGLQTDGTRWAWGVDGAGQLGNSPGTSFIYTPTQIGLDTDWVNMQAGASHSLGLRFEGYHLLAGTHTLSFEATDAAGNTSTCAFTVTVEDNEAPTIACLTDITVEVDAGACIATVFSDLSPSTSDNCRVVDIRQTSGIKPDRSLWAWGYDGQGQLGNGQVVSHKNSPVPIGQNLNWTYISATATHSLGIQKDGSLWAWGANDFGKLGIGNTQPQGIPTQVGTSTDWRTVSTGTASLGIKSDGTLWAWGKNNFGQLGIGNNVDQHSPVQVGCDTDWIAISAGNSYTLGIRADGSLWSWGNNPSGQLGIGNAPAQNVPVQVGSYSDWVMVDAGFSHALGIRANGTLWAWGTDNKGQLGDGGINQKKSTPVQIGNDTDWVSVSAGTRFSLAIRSTGTLWAWGEDTFGQLGDGGSNTDQGSPVQVGNATNWSTIAAGFDHALGTQTDGTLWAWGRDNLGQLGDGGPNVNVDSPIQIGSSSNWVEIAAASGFSLSLQHEGYKFPLGSNTVSFEASDASGNTSGCSFTITVEDNEAPSITCPTTTIKRNTDPATCAHVAVGTDLDPAISDNCSFTAVNDLSGTGTLAGTTLPKGKSTVTWTATDAAGNSTTCTYDIRIRDREAPVFDNCPDDSTIIVPAYSGGSYFTFPALTASDNCNPAHKITISGFPLSGSFCAVGVTTFNWTATDKANNVGHCNFDVTVQEAGTPAPNGWSNNSVGNGNGCHTNYDPTAQTLTIQSAGGNVNLNADNFCGITIPNSDQAIDFRARVTPAGNGYYDQAGIMMRQSLASNAKHATMLLTGTSVPMMTMRASAGGFPMSTTGTAVTKPYWLRLYRLGGTITGYISADGVNWTSIMTYPNLLSTPLYLVLFSTTAGPSGQATFDNISINGVAARLGENAMGTDLRLKAYPNPFSEDLFIDVDNALPGETYKVRLSNMLGQRVYGYETGASAEGKIEQRISLEHLPAGNYLLEVSAGVQRASLKVVKR